MNRKITCTNNDGMALTFGSAFSPYLLVDCDGIYEVENNVSISNNTMIDGATYQGMVTNKRNIVITLKEKSNHKENRYQLYQLFKPKTKGTFIYEEDGEKRSIDYYVEKINIASETKVRTATISLICPDPFFEAPSDITLVMAGWKPEFEFLHEFKAEGEELGTRIDEKLKTIDNISGAEGIGLTISVKAIGNVINPSVTLVEAGEFIKVGTSGNPFEMNTGDELIITTGTNNKKVKVNRGGLVIDINEYLDERSEFIQLQSGLNTIGYSADSGENNMTVSISYRYKYLGV